MEIGHRGLLSFIAFVFIFPIFYLFTPIWIAYIINTIIIIVSCYFTWKKDEKKLTIVALCFFVLNTYFIIKYVSTLELLAQTLTLDWVEYLRAQALGYVITKFIEYLPLFIIFLTAFGFLYFYAFISTRGASTYRFALILGYVGSIMTLILIFIDMYMDANASPWEKIFRIFIFNNPVAVPFEIYYYIQISIWYMSGFTFIVTFLTHLSGGGKD